MSEVPERIAALRELMEEGRIDAYLIPTSDYHESEYVGEHFACRNYMTGFTGSAGTALIMQDWAGVWTDGRYFVQAAAELADSGVTLMKMGQPEVPTLEEYLEEHMPMLGTLGFDGRVINSKIGEELKKRLESKKISFAYTEALVGDIWEDRPPLSAEPVWILEDRYAGKPAVQKIADLRAEMEKRRADVHILTTLDDIVWLLNIRGNDIPCNPVVLSYVTVTKDSLNLFINQKTLSGEVRAYLEGLGVTICDYQEIYTNAQQIRCSRVLLEKGKVNYMIVQCLDESNVILDEMNPTVLAKAQKTAVEIENLKAAHIKDGVAMTKYIYWLKHNIGKIPMTECSVEDYLETLRREQGAIELSFTTISAYGANAAMCHYHAVPGHCATLEPRGLYLVDSGGQYLEGTTDITRTLALGPVTEAEREHYTLVLMGMLRLGHVKFMKGCSGLSLDYAAREPLWKRGLDFNHGTGHGVGYLLNVHERPVGIRFRVVPERQDSAPFLPGMVCSDEPGLYIEGSHGIRTENMIFCKEAETTQFGQFLCFEFLTYAPIDLEPVDVSLMEEQDIAYLNEYHAQVYEKIAPYLTGEEAAWLKKVTQPLRKL
ncbi:MAG: aminopeptidase P family protein [Lachnospiraceae bacterium]|nr:aminopeptidase P family protein [Lachnospiraceae bacterium]